MANDLFRFFYFDRPMLPRFYPVKVIFGHPFSREELIKKAKKESGIDDYEIIARSLRDEVLRLKEETDKNDKEKDFFRRSGN